MNPLVKKEIRLLLPSFAICCALAVANLFINFDSNGSVVGWWWYMLAFAFCGGAAVMMALNSFGAEISSGTFSHLLAQPISRQKIWETKIVVLAVSLAVVGMVWGGFGTARFVMLDRQLDWVAMITVIGIFGLVIFSGGLWTVLLLRQVAAAFWFTVLVPGVFLALVAACFGDQEDLFVKGMVVSVLGVYSLAGFFFARWLFFRAQDVQWSGCAIVMPEFCARAKSETGLRRIWRPRLALFFKELQLHQAQFLIAGVLLVLHLGVRVTRAVGNFNRNSTTEFILESFWLLWLVMPLLVGCAAVAEERKLGTHEGQLCLPAKRRTQFALKLLVALGLTLVFGTLMPLLLEGGSILPGIHFNVSLPHGWEERATTTAQVFFWWNCLGAINGLLPLLTLAGIAVLIGGISFYVSSLERNTLQTLAPALAGIALAWFLILVATIPWQYEPYAPAFLWRGPLVYLIALPVMALTLLALAWRNYQRILPDWKVSGRNLLTLACAFGLGVTLTSAIYHRVWEKLTPFEPPHGAARLSLANPPALNQQRDEIIVRLPDGKIWTGMVSFNSDGLNPIKALLSSFQVSLTAGKCFAGTNWVSVQRFVGGLAGIKTDGTLWLSEKLGNANRRGQWTWPRDLDKPFAQFGTETNWSSATPFQLSMLLVKKDGTLWQWGPEYFDFQHEKWPGLQAFTPQRLGTESNWAEVHPRGYDFSLRKTDGSVWGVYQWPTNGQTLLEVETNFVVRRMPGDRPAEFTSTARLTHGLSFMVGVRRDGTFRIWSDQHAHPSKKYRAFTEEYIWQAADLQIGAETNWLAVAEAGNELVTLKSDGSLWVWKGQRSFYRQEWRPEHYESEVLKMVPVRLGTHSDWIATAGSFGEIITLAADGSLWFWPLQPAQFFYDDNNQPIQPLLDVSHKPQFLGNVFSSENKTPD